MSYKGKRQQLSTLYAPPVGEGHFIRVRTLSFVWRYVLFVGARTKKTSNHFFPILKLHSLHYGNVQVIF